jgi:hypothetical protein
VWEGRKRDLIPFFGHRLGANSLLAVWEAPKAICNWISILGGDNSPTTFTTSMQGQAASLGTPVVETWRVAGISALLDKGHTANSLRSSSTVVSTVSTTQQLTLDEREEA